ncbi:MAG: class I SAM-dependent methyltransferase [Bacteroidetes bacterium]|nr:class I SAM-dependent methyltransferase [Bacteroidota bacterium]
MQNYAKGQLLDIGCGNKPYFSLFKDKIDAYVGCDIVQSSNNCVDIVSEATNIPLEGNIFDTVFSTQTIEHIGDFQLMLNEAYRLAKNDGIFILAGPMYWPLHEEPYDFYRFTKHGFAFSLKKAGFEVIEIIPNGGKWALLGQVLIQTLPTWLTFPKIMKRIHNAFFTWLDKKYFDSSNTMNYVVISKKIY